MPADINSLDAEIIRRCSEFSMQTPERLFAVTQAIQYVERNSVPGSIVECGVWRGGGMMAAAMTLVELHSTSRELFLYDTFEGMTAPTAADTDLQGGSAEAHLDSAGARRPESWIWAYAALNDVRRNLASTGYDQELVHFIKGPVEETIPSTLPDQIAVLRLDTDWYESTRHELEHLVPRVVSGGVLLIDDYGHWQGARKAVDEWLHDFGRPVLLHRTDETGRAAVLF